MRFSGGTTVNVRVASSAPFEKVNSKTAAREPPPTYTRSPFRENVRPSQPSATGTRLVSRPVAVSSTLIVGGLYPPFSTSRYRPSGRERRGHGKRIERYLFARGIQTPTAIEQKAAAGKRPDLLARSRLGTDNSRNGEQRREGEV